MKLVDCETCGKKYNADVFSACPSCSPSSKRVPPAGKWPGDEPQPKSADYVNPWEKHSKRSKTSNSGSGGIDSIIRRMWWWILAQSFVVGIWAGSSNETLECRLDDTRCSFNFPYFVLGVLISIGAFAPLVFVVEAIREVVRSINKSKDN